MSGVANLVEAVSASDLRSAMGRFATGVSVVTCTGASGEPIGSTVSAVSSLSLDPPLVLVCLREESETLASLVGRGGFAINILADGQQQLARHFAQRSAAGGWRHVRYRLGRHGLPTLVGSLATLECSLHDVADGGDHRVVIGRVLEVAHPKAHVRPLLYFRGEFARLQEPTPPGTREPSTLPALSDVFLPTRDGEMTVVPVESGGNATSLIALVGQPQGSTGTLVYLHRGCLFGDALGHLGCRRNIALEAALARIRTEASGVLVYHRDDSAPFAGCCADPGAAKREQPGDSSQDSVLGLRDALAGLGLRRVRLLRCEELDHPLPHASIGLDVARVEPLLTSGAGAQDGV